MMATPGARLRQAREQAGLTLHDVAEQTKIQRWILDRIEDDDLARVPGGIFIRGYLTSFALAVGLDGDRLWAEYRADTERHAAEPEVPVAPMEARRGRPLWTMVGIAAAVVVTAVVWRNMPRSNPDSANVAVPQLPDHPSEVVPAAATSTPRPEAVVALDATKGDRPRPSSVSLAIKLHASADVWVEVKADRQPRVYRLVTAGEDLAVDARREIVLRVGDASAVTYTINGAPGRPLGGPGMVREIVVSADSYRTLLVSGTE
jgi:cytoskeleton protein RodZ